MANVGYYVHEAVFVLWLLVCAVLTAMNIYHERFYYAQDRKRLVQIINGTNTFMFIMLAIAAPDFQGVLGIYDPYGPVLSFGFGFCTSLIVMAGFSYIYLTMKAAIYVEVSAENFMDLHNDSINHTLQILRRTCGVFIVITFVLNILYVALYESYQRGFIYSIFLFWIAGMGTIAIAIFLAISFRLKSLINNAMPHYPRLPSSFTRMKQKLTNVQVTIPAFFCLITIHLRGGSELTRAYPMRCGLDCGDSVGAGCDRLRDLLRSMAAGYWCIANSQF
jgi:hypothetical protein